jgi:hypothetical protein
LRFWEVVGRISCRDDESIRCAKLHLFVTLEAFYTNSVRSDPSFFFAFILCQLFFDVFGLTFILFDVFVLSKPLKTHKFLGTGLGYTCISSFSQKDCNDLDDMQLRH